MSEGTPRVKSILTDEEMSTPHPVFGSTYGDPIPDHAQVLYLAGGCFWGMEQIFWQVPGVLHTFVGYMGGTTPNPTYDEVCTGTTGHAETVRVVFDPALAGSGGEEILRAYWNNHNSTQRNRHYGDIGEQYRSEVWCTTSQQFEVAQLLKNELDVTLAQQGKSCVTVISCLSDNFSVAQTFYPAEHSHQAYLHHQPYGYCSHQPQSVTI